MGRRYVGRLELGRHDICCGLLMFSVDDVATPASVAPSIPPSASQWTCSACTFQNANSVSVCEVCEHKRPIAPTVFHNPTVVELPKLSPRDLTKHSPRDLPMHLSELPKRAHSPRDSKSKPKPDYRPLVWHCCVMIFMSFL